MIPAIFSYFPVGAHLGIFKTIQKMRQAFVWKSKDADIKSRIRRCNRYALSKMAQDANLVQLASEVRQRSFQNFFVDYVGKFSRSKTLNTMLLVCVDVFFKFVWIVPFGEATTKAIITNLQQRVFANPSVPEMIVTNDITCFRSQHF